MSSIKRPASELHDLRPPKSSQSRNTSPETPTKKGSASVSKSQSVSGLSTTKTSETASQAEISYFLKSELNDAVWHDPDLFDKHPCPDNVLERIFDKYPGLNPGHTQWTHPVPQGEEQNSYNPIQTPVVMQPSRPLRDAVDAFELAAGMVGALIGHWALVTNKIQHQDINLNSVLLTHGVHKNKRPEWVQLHELGVDQCVQEFRLPEKLFNQPNMPGYRTVEELKCKFNPRRRLEFLTRTIRVLGRPEPFGFLSDLDMANIITITRENASDMHIHRTGTPAFMAVELLPGLLAKPTKPVPHTYVHDLESFFWVLLYTIAEHQEGGAPVNSNALEVLERLDRLDNTLLGDGKFYLLGAIVDGTLDVRSFGTVWAEFLAPVVEGFAEWVNNARKPSFNSTNDPDACFETVLSYFLDAMPDLQASRNHPLG
ncbi:unnamed protein product [Rhizoctonia solani]|uniref:Fungal-type protein kinase domain-containing protein n=1 Tax=Rhizoctonia solani TaxID=456999 RepID=A0A8H2Y1E4_9AGAM|nr:unnamed protein product [Rhizoctonia solani]